MTYRNFNIILTLAITMVAVCSCQKEVSTESKLSPLTLKMNLIANGAPLELNTAYVDDLGEDYSVTAFKFYISNISISDGESANSAEQESYHLVDASNAGTRSFSAQLGRISFNRIRFLVGVDSLRNVSGAQTGALDPMNGMFWTWNSGYIMAKLEGTSTFSTAPGQRIQYHIGGYAGAEATQRWVTLGFPGGGTYTITPEQPLALTIDVDLDKWFHSAHDLPISANPLVMTPGPLSVQQADNYATMFTVTKVGQP
jgi:hypothetical protein